MLRSLAGAAAIMMILPQSAQAQTPTHTGAPAATGRHYDKPINVRSVKQGNNDKETRCTYYADVMVRETLDGPTAGNPLIVAPAEGAPCNGAPIASGRAIRLEDHALGGRAGHLLFFLIMDGHGAVPFSVFDIRKGRIIFSDAVLRDFRLVARRPDGSVRLHYERGINADCSLLKDAKGCWAKLVAERKIPPVMADRAPQGQICATAYANSLGSPTPADAPSIVSYDVEMTIDPDGKIEVGSRGPVKCIPLP